MYHYVDGKMQKIPEMFTSSSSSPDFRIGHKYQILIVIVIALAVGGYFAFREIKK